MNKHRYTFLGLVLVLSVLFAAQFDTYAAERPQVFDKDKDGFEYVNDVKLIEKDKTDQEGEDDGERIILEIKALEMWILPLAPFQPVYVKAVK